MEFRHRRNKALVSTLRPGAGFLLLVFVAFLAACTGSPTGQTIETAPTPTASPATPSSLSMDPASLGSFGQTIRFRNLTSEDGLSQSVVADIVQDDLGFLWFGTQEGLNRYDGYELKVFRGDPQAPNSLANSQISALEKDASGILWIGTGIAGLDRYDPQTGKFTHYANDPSDPESLSDNAVMAVLAASDGRIWVGTTNGGLNVLDPAVGKFTRYQNIPGDLTSLSSNTIFALLEDSEGRIWAGTPGFGVNCLDPKTGEISHYYFDPEDPQGISSNGVQTLFQDRQGVIWAGTLDSGLNRLDMETGEWTRYLHDPDDPASLSINAVTEIFEDRWGRLWIGTNGGGLDLLDRRTGKFTHYPYDPNNPDSLPNNSVASIFEDRSGMLWVGTFGSGVAFYDPYKEKFGAVQPDPANPHSLDLIWSVYQDPQGILWIGTNGGGLNRLDPQTGEWKHYRAEEEGLVDDIVFYAVQDREGMLWVGTNLGLNRFDPKTETFELITYGFPVYSILEDREGTIWFGTGSVGLGRISPSTGEITYYQNIPDDPTSLASNIVISLREDSAGNLWVGAFGGGLNRLDPQTGGFVRYMNTPSDQETISDNTVLTIYEADNSRFWIGTSRGLNSFDPQSGIFTSYGEKDGLANEFVYGILEDDQGKLWISTNKGISSFDPDGPVIKNYDKSDGLLSTEFNQGAYFKNREGTMFFGGVNGLNVFNPAQIQNNPYIPPVVLTKFDLFNQTVQAGEGSPLSQPIEASREIRLAYTDDFFEFGFAALHFSTPEETQYAYMMEGLDKDWHYVTNRRFATYTNVPPGNYTFRVKGSNSDGVWNDAGTTVRIVIPPPFWQTLWFRLLVILGAAAAITGVMTLRIRSMEGQRRRLEELVSERTQQLRETMFELAQSKDAAEAANRAKSVFLANMSHEFRTPLNAILGFTQIMKRDDHLPAEHQENVHIIHRSSEHLLGLINDVLEMSKIEAGRTTLNAHSFDLPLMLAGLVEMFKLRAGKKGVRLELEISPDTPPYVCADEGKLRQVLMNLLGNAVKFTQQGQIRLRIHPCSTIDDQVSLPARIAFEVEDTGPGIAHADLDKIFVPFVQTETGQKSQEGTGLGLSISQQFVHLMGGEIQVTSRVGVGSTFRFEIPVDLVSAQDLEKPQPARKVVGVEPGQETVRMLVVDDQEVNRKLIVKFFTPLGIEIREAANGLEALEIWKEWAPHLIWMDMRMPVMDGYEATRRIKSTTQGQATVIIALTASSLEEDRSIILSEGCNDYMRKPFREEEIYNMAAKHLGVNYRYEAISPQTEVGRGSVQAPTLASSGLAGNAAIRLAAAAPGWLADLERATILGDEQTILRLTGQIAETDPGLAGEISALAAKFDHDQILSMIREARRIKEHEAG